MSSYTIVKNGTVTTPDHLISDGVVVIRDSSILETGRMGEVALPENAAIVDAEKGYISPGFVDIHVNGADGADVTLPDRTTFPVMSRFFPRYGTTAYVGTIITASPEDILRSLRSAREYLQVGTDPGAELLGILLSGSCTQDSRQDDESGGFIHGKTGIILAGSSITWGVGGRHGPGSIMTGFAGHVLDYLLNDLSTTLLPEELRFSGGDTSWFRNKLLYKGSAVRIDGLHAKTEFDLYGDEIAICQVALRTPDHGVMTVRADGKVIGQFTNVNGTLGEEQQTFTGDGITVKFALHHPATYAHEVLLDGRKQQGRIYTGGWSRQVPENPGYLIIRKLDEEKKPVHYIWFRHAPEKGAHIVVRYKYGRIISFEGSTQGQLDRDEENESAYGEGKVSHDLTRPAVISSGLEYRYVDRNAFWVHKFTQPKKRHYEIEITGGRNPYFILNFVSNRYHDFMNAGIGGWKLSLLLDGDGVNDYTGFFDHFLPDILVNESATNDDANYSARKLHRTVTGLTEEEVKKLWTYEIERIVYNRSRQDYTVTFTTGIITRAGKYRLQCPQIRGSKVQPGDIIRIGMYHGDNRQVICRVITSVDREKGIITWERPLLPQQILNVDSYEDLKGAECSVRDLSGYKELYEEFIRKVRKISPATRILITQPGLSNYRRRALWGYEIIHRQLAAEFPAMGVIEVRDRLNDYQNENISGKEAVELTADGKTVYTLPWKGHWQGFQVWVDGKDMYGTDCYIECGGGYCLDPAKHGEELQLDRPYLRPFLARRPMKLVFTRNVPEKGRIRVVRADNNWSWDYCHTNQERGYIYGQSYISKINGYLQ